MHPARTTHSPPRRARAVLFMPLLPLALLFAGATWSAVAPDTKPPQIVATPGAGGAGGAGPQGPGHAGAAGVARKVFAPE